MIRSFRDAATEDLFCGRDTYTTTLQADLWSAAAHADSTAVAVLETGAQERNPAPSPDGTLLAYTSTESGRTQVYLRAPYRRRGTRAGVPERRYEPRLVSFRR